MITLSHMLLGNVTAFISLKKFDMAINHIPHEDEALLIQTFLILLQ